ncbi:MAG: M1 family peptidase [Desulfomonile tiedjei]|nr:M1 family peptidase [Desulfomonile tiedjei]
MIKKPAKFAAHAIVCICLAILSTDSMGRQVSPKPNSRVHHDLKVTLHPAEHRLSAEDRVTLAEGSAHSFHFELHGGLEPKAVTLGVTLVRESERQAEVPVTSYRVTLPHGTRTCDITYEGEIYHALQSHGTETARGFRHTPGMISAEGVYLTGESYWYPRFDDGLITFDLELNLPADWEAVSQGERTSHDSRDGFKSVRWACTQPQEEIALAAARFFESARPAGNTETMVFLREPDEALAKRYLDATAVYLAMYDTLIGPYAYKKFALVENYWETGYGLPSFTLMGSKIIRFPFIIDSSYPHEILHNWWGNGVFPDPRGGNWSEGLTAYLADHLIREQRGTAVEYRRDVLQKYTDYVSRQNDFPLTEFRSRHSSATEAIGYGKALMFFHMLRLDLGDETFRNGLRGLYRNYKFKYARYDDIRKSFETVSGKDLGPMFAQWVDRTGAPQLKVTKARMERSGDSYVATALLEQVQPGPAYRLRVPVALTLEGQEQAHQTSVLMEDKRHEAEFRLSHRPLRIDVDPEFDVFRRLDRGEIPPALTQIFGAKKLTFLIPRPADKTMRNAYQAFAQSWAASGPEAVQAVDDSDMKGLLTDSPLIIFGWENRFLSELSPELAKYGVRVTEQGLTIGESTFPRADHSVVLIVRRPGERNLVAAWVASDRVDALAGLARKVPHYDKYSYLVFRGDEPANVLKGHWPVFNSPLSLFFPGEDGSISKVPMGKLIPRKPLAERP